MKIGKKSRKSVSISDFYAGYTEGYQKKLDLYSKKRTSGVLSAILIAILSFTVGFSAGKIFAPTSTTSATSSEGIEIGATSTSETTLRDTKKLIEKEPGSTLKNEADIIKPTYTLEIPSIGLYTNIIPTYVNENNDIVVPAAGAGALTSFKGRYFNLLVGHRANIFKNLGNLRYGDTIKYYGVSYQVSTIYQEPEADINMYSLTSNSTELKLITCAGEGNTERLVVIASPINAK